MNSDEEPWSSEVRLGLYIGAVIMVKKLYKERWRRYGGGSDLFEKERQDGGGPKAIGNEQTFCN